MDTSAADYTDLPVGLMLEPDQGRALVGLDVHGEFIPFAELKLAAVVEMLAAASDRQAQQVQAQPATQTQTQQTQDTQGSTEPQVSPPATEPQVSQEPQPAPSGEPAPPAAEQQPPQQ